MIVAIERTKFTYLYKYNQIRVDINQLIDKSTNELKDMLNNDLNNLIQLFNKITINTVNDQASIA